MSKHLTENEIFDALEGKARSDFSKARIIGVDVERYQHLLDAADLGDEEKAEVIESLWMIIMTFIDFGYQVHPLQEVCGKLLQNQADGAEETDSGARMET